MEREIVMRFAGNCRACGVQLQAGAAAAWAPGSGVRCLRCAARRDADPKRTVLPPQTRREALRAANSRRARDEIGVRTVSYRRVRT